MVISPGLHQALGVLGRGREILSSEVELTRITQGAEVRLGKQQLLAPWATYHDFLPARQLVGRIEAV